MIIYQPLYTMKEAALVLRISLQEIYYLTEKGTLPYVRIGRKRKIRGSDLEYFIGSCRREV